jgi:hypothetical protein
VTRLRPGQRATVLQLPVQADQPFIARPKVHSGRVLAR